MGAWLEKQHWMWPWLLLSVLSVILAGIGLVVIGFERDIVIDVIRDHFGLRLEEKSISITAGILAIVFSIGAYEIYIVYYYMRILHQVNKSRRVLFGHSTGSDRNQITFSITEQ